MTGAEVGWFGDWLATWTVIGWGAALGWEGVGYDEILDFSACATWWRRWLVLPHCNCGAIADHQAEWLSRRITCCGACGRGLQRIAEVFCMDAHLTRTAAPDGRTTALLEVDPPMVRR